MLSSFVWSAAYVVHLNFSISSPIFCYSLFLYINGWLEIGLVGCVHGGNVRWMRRFLLNWKTTKEDSRSHTEVILYMGIWEKREFNIFYHFSFSSYQFELLENKNWNMYSEWDCLSERKKLTFSWENQEY